MSPDLHAQKCTDPSSRSTESEQVLLADPPSMSDSLILVPSPDDECSGIDSTKIYPEINHRYQA